MLDYNSVKCENPVVIFNRAVIPYILSNGCVLKGKFMHFDVCRDALIDNFPYDKFKPFKNQICFKIGDKYIIDSWAFNSSYTFDFSGKKVDLYLLVPCGHCDMCFAHRADVLANRLHLEALSHSCPPLFITLTYDDKHLPPDGVQKQQIQNFFKRLRNYYPEIDLRYYLAAEYGTQRHRPHYHMLLFNAPVNQFDNVSIFDFHTTLCRCWCDDLRKHSKAHCYKSYSKTSKRYYVSQLGAIDLRVTDGNKSTYRYVSKYMNKSLIRNYPNKNPVFQLRSLGLGRSIIPKIKNDFYTCGTETQIYNHFSGNFEPLQIDSYLLRKLVPSVNQLVNVECRRAIGNLNEQFRILAQFGYIHTHRLVDKFERLLSPFRCVKSLLIPELHKYNVAKDFDFSSAWRHNKYLVNGDEFVNVSSPLLDTLLYLKSCYTLISNTFNNLNPQKLQSNMLFRHQYFNNLERSNKIISKNEYRSMFQKNNSLFRSKHQYSLDNQ